MVLQGTHPTSGLRRKLSIHLATVNSRINKVLQRAGALNVIGLICAADCTSRGTDSRVSDENFKIPYGAVQVLRKQIYYNYEHPVSLSPCQQK